MFDPRRYQWMIGGFGLMLVVAFSIYLSTHGRAAAPGVPAGSRLHEFVAPLASSGLDAAANAHPRCDPRRPAKRGLNVCDRGSIVLAFFALGAAPCEREVGTLQTVSRRFPGIRFAAVAVDADRAATRRLIRTRHWTIPVAYDASGAIGQLYRVAVCPLIELARSDGIVARRLIGEGWERPARLARAVRSLAGARPQT